jgi:hypothetical protein
MSYSIGLKTKSKDQAKEILNYINNFCPTIDEIFSSANRGHNLNWDTGDNLSYIKDKTVVGIDNKPSEDEAITYFYSLLYFLAHKFKATETINGQEYAVINYDGNELWILSKENPFLKIDNPKEYGFVKINNLGIKESHQKTFSKLINGTKKYEKIIINAISKLK